MRLSWLLFFWALWVPLAARTPRFTWGQDKVRLYMTIQAECTGNRVVDIKSDSFRFSCDGPNGPHELQFVLREDVVPETSSCNETQKTQVCELVKKDEHLFDRLVEDPRPFKKLMSIDWRVGRSERRDDDDDDDAADFFSGTPVTTLSPKALNQTLEKHELVILYVGYRWCSKCNHIRDHLISIARGMKKEAFFGAVDPLDNRYARGLFDPGCDYTCYFHIHRKGEAPYKFRYSYDAEQQIQRLRGYKLPLLTSIASSAELDAFKTAQPTFALGVFASQDAPEAVVFKEAARNFRGEVPFATVTGDVDGYTTRPAVHLFKPNSSATEFKGDFLSAQALVRFINVSSLPNVLEHDYELRTKLDGMGLPGIQFWVKAEDTASPLHGIMEQLSAALMGRMYAMKLDDARHSWMKDDFGTKDLVAAIRDATGDDGNRYAFSGPLTFESLSKFCEDFLAGSLAPTYKSEAAPDTEWQPGTLLKVVRNTLGTMVANDKAVLLGFHKSWFGEWKSAEKMLQAAAELLVGIPDVVLGSYDMNNNHFPKAWFNGTDFHKAALALFPANGDAAAPKPIVYEGKLKQANVLEFLRKQVPSVQAGWDTIQAGLTRIREEQKAAKKAKKEAARAEAERLASIPKVDVTPDSGVTKQILTEGTGASPPKGSKVQAHYTGKLTDGTVFDSSRERGTPFDFTLGQGQVIKCWDEGFATMKVGEQAVLTCKSDYAYGASGSPPKIPAHATLAFDVELLSFTPPASEAKDEL